MIKAAYKEGILNLIFQMFKVVPMITKECDNF